MGQHHELEGIVNGSEASRVHNKLVRSLNLVSLSSVCLSLSLKRFAVLSSTSVPAENSKKCLISVDEDRLVFPVTRPASE